MSQFTYDKILKVALEVRSYFEEDLEGDWSLLDLSCLGMSKYLEKELNAVGLCAMRIPGRYYGADLDYEPDMAEWSEDDRDNYAFENGFTHWWVDCDDYIVDICVDQFHPSQRKDYRVVILNIKTDITADYGK